MTAPLRKATLSAFGREVRAAAAVRVEARVAVCMPKKPARAENSPPARNVNGSQSLWAFRPQARIAKTTARPAKAMPMTLYCWRR